MGQGLRRGQFWGIAIATVVAVCVFAQSHHFLAEPALASAEVAQASGVEALIEQANEQFASRDYPSAERSYRAVLDQLQETDTAYSAIALVTHNLARTYLLTAQYAEALALLESLEASGQANNPALNNLALAYFHLGNYGAAEQVLTRVLAEWEDIRAGDELDDLDKVTLFEQQAHSYGLMQRTLVAQGKIEAALAMAERARARALTELLGEEPRGDRARVPLTVPHIQAAQRNAGHVFGARRWAAHSG